MPPFRSSNICRPDSNAVMTDAIETNASGPAEVERLRVSLYEHLFESEAYDDMEDWTLTRSLERICADLGLGHHLLAADQTPRRPRPAASAAL